MKSLSRLWLSESVCIALTSAGLQEPIREKLADIVHQLWERKRLTDSGPLSMLTNINLHSLTTTHFSHDILRFQSGNNLQELGRMGLLTNWGCSLLWASLCWPACAPGWPRTPEGPRTPPALTTCSPDTDTASRCTLVRWRGRNVHFF